MELLYKCVVGDGFDGFGMYPAFGYSSSPRYDFK